MSDELKPCPFCGGDAEHFGGGGNHCIRCTVCEVTNETLKRGSMVFDAYRTAEEAVEAWNARAERECRFTLEEDREALAEKAACGPGEFVTQDMPELLWTCSACGEQYANGLDALPGWLKHCPNCGAKVAG